MPTLTHSGAAAPADAPSVIATSPSPAIRILHFMLPLPSVCVPPARCATINRPRSRGYIDHPTSTMPSEAPPDSPIEPAAVPATAPAESALRGTARRAGRVARWIGFALGGLVVLIVAIAAWIAFIGITIDAAGLRPRIAEAFSDALKREVRFDGPAQLEISARPKLKVGGLAVADPGGFAEGTLVSVGELRLALDLWKLMAHRLHIQDLAGSDVVLKLHTTPTAPTIGPSRSRPPTPRRSRRPTCRPTPRPRWMPPPCSMSAASRWNGSRSSTPRTAAGATSSRSTACRASRPAASR
jgi:hypothetical protein